MRRNTKNKVNIKTPQMIQRTSHRVKAQRARKAWKRLKEQARIQADNETNMTVKDIKEKELLETTLV